MVDIPQYKKKEEIRDYRRKYFIRFIKEVQLYVSFTLYVCVYVCACVYFSSMSPTVYHL